MRPTLLFFGYLFLCLALGALLTVPVMQTGWVDYEPQRVMGRLAQLFILLGLWPFLRLLGLDQRGALGFGLARRPFLLRVGLGWLLGVLILAALMWALLALGVRVPDVPASGIAAAVADKAVTALIGGLLIGLLEELFFRGALFSAIRRRGTLARAVVWSALLYALVHVLKPHDLPDGMAFDWDGAQVMFAQVFTGLFQWKHVDTLAALFMAGVLLALVRERTGHIGWCIGLHAGWVFVIQVGRRVTDGDDGAALAFLAGDYDGVIGWLAVLWLALLSWLYWRLLLAPGRRRVAAATGSGRRQGT
jgi:membrane protease YdiL (CAAX protease family)